MQRTKWTPEEVRECEETHERVIAQYPDEIQRELRLARIKWLAKVPRTPERTGAEQ